MKLKIIFLIIFAVMIFSPIKVYAQTKAEAATIGVSAAVPSDVAPEKSVINLNTSETLADPVGHSILLTIQLFDKNSKPLVNKEVVVTSNRGQVDIIEAVSKLSQYKVQAAAISDMQKDKTDENGKTQFRITSFIPGKVILTIIADGVVQLKQVEITFLPLPFPSNVTVSLSLPGIQKEINILSPQSQEQNLSPSQQASKSLVNTGTKIKIPFWIFILLAVLFIGAPIFIILNFINLRKLRKAEKQEIAILEKITASSDINQLRDGIRRDSFKS